MNQLLKNSLVILFFLVLLALMLKESQKEYFNDFKVSKIGKISEIFPKKSKGIKSKYPVDRGPPTPIAKDKIEDIQLVDPDIVDYLNR